MLSSYILCDPEDQRKNYIKTKQAHIALKWKCVITNKCQFWNVFSYQLRVNLKKLKHGIFSERGKLSNPKMVSSILQPFGRKLWFFRALIFILCEKKWIFNAQTVAAMMEGENSFFFSTGGRSSMAQLLSLTQPFKLASPCPMFLHN